LFGGANIPHELRECTFASLAQLPNTQEQQAAALKVQAFMLPRARGEYTGYKRGLYLYGAWGRGKSGLAVAALRLAAENGQTVLFLPTIELFANLYDAIGASQRLMRGYGDEEDRQEDTAAAKLLRLVLQVKWLVLDDLAAECANKFVIRELYRIIEGRRADGLYTIFTSNRDATDLGQYWRPDSPRAAAFNDCERVIERLGEYCVAIPVAGRSLRQRMSGSHE
jgi:DNA replication protein DnaC